MFDAMITGVVGALVGLGFVGAFGAPFGVVGVGAAIGVAAGALWSMLNPPPRPPTRRRSF